MTHFEAKLLLIDFNQYGLGGALFFDETKEARKIFINGKWEKRYPYSIILENGYEIFTIEQGMNYLEQTTHKNIYTHRKTKV